MNRDHFILSSQSISETQQIAALLATLLEGGSCVGFKGPLGAGKTEFIRGISLALGAKGEISSPSYVLEHIYELPKSELTLHHWDLYRLKSEEGGLDLFESIGDEKKIVFVEWPERISTVLDLLSLEISLEYDFSEDRKVDSVNFRKIAIYKKRSAELFQKLYQLFQAKGFSV